MAKKNARGEAFTRVRHALWAGLIALVLTVLTVPAIIDQFVWLAQKQIRSLPASGQIVYVGAEDSLIDPDFPHRREQLAQLINKLNQAGVKDVYVNMVFEQPTTPEADGALHEALTNLRGRAHLSRTVFTNLNGEDELRSSVASVSDGIPAFGNTSWLNYLGYGWAMPYTVETKADTLPNFSTMLAGSEERVGEEFPINYFFDFKSIPTFRFQDLSGETHSLNELAGKTVVIGQNQVTSGSNPNIPGHVNVPISIVHIYAAETLLSGELKFVGEFLTLFCAFALLFGISLIGADVPRRVIYGMALAALPIAFAISSLQFARLSLGSALIMLFIYGLFRARALWRKNILMVDGATNLPTFAALECDKEVADSVPAIIVAKIHRFEEVRKTLPPELQTEYLLRIIDRLRAAKHDALIYKGEGHLLAWTFPEKEPALIREHLEGLRALFSSPLTVGNQQVDVSVTFGVDITPSPNVTRRLAAAVSAAERTTETYEPIEIAELASDEDLIWSISLQARIDAALASGEIYLLYQPKVLVQTGELVGVEALVRWRDPKKGLIPPDHFIRQCENAGRMSHLTRHVLREACNAGNELEDNGLTLPVSVNISATLVHERAIVDMVREVLEETGFEPHRLTLEITETYRISNFEQTSVILEELASLGPKISMDDFGVGAASLEALQRLPFSELKIDKTFTLAMTTNPRAAGIVRSVLAMGKELRIIVVAEGVEDESTLTLLRDSGCLVAQGFGISHPITLDEIITFQPLSAREGLRDRV